jgi:hypothetical protein
MTHALNPCDAAHGEDYSTCCGAASKA